MPVTCKARAKAKGYPFGDPNDMDYSILGSIVGFPIKANYNVYEPWSKLLEGELYRVWGLRFGVSGLNSGLYRGVYRGVL